MYASVSRQGVMAWPNIGGSTLKVILSPSRDAPALCVPSLAYPMTTMREVTGGDGQSQRAFGPAHRV